ncbi:Integrase catalytic domain-containing protein [Pycnococcus provasolii]
MANAPLWSTLSPDLQDQLTSRVEGDPATASLPTPPRKIRGLATQGEHPLPPGPRTSTRLAAQGEPHLPTGFPPQGEASAHPPQKEHQTHPTASDPIHDLDQHLPPKHGHLDTLDDFLLDPASNTSSSADGWSAKERVNLQTHCALGHRSRAHILQMQKRGLISPHQWYKEAALPHCDACARGLLRRNALRIRYHTESLPRDPSEGEYIVMDMLPLQRKSLGKYTSILVAVDAASKYVHVKPLKDASEQKRALQEIIAFWKAHKKTVLRMREDRGSNFLSDETLQWMANAGIHKEPTVADQHHQAGLAEKHIDLISRMALAWLKAANIDEHYFRAHALTHAAALLNRSPRGSIDYRIPITMACGIKPDYNNGCRHDVDMPRDPLDVVEEVATESCLGFSGPRETREVPPQRHLPGVPTL